MFNFIKFSFEFELKWTMPQKKSKLGSAKFDFYEIAHVKIGFITLQKICIMGIFAEVQSRELFFH